MIFLMDIDCGNSIQIVKGLIDSYKDSNGLIPTDKLDDIKYTLYVAISKNWEIRPEFKSAIDKGFSNITCKGDKLFIYQDEYKLGFAVDISNTGKVSIDYCKPFYFYDGSASEVGMHFGKDTSKKHSFGTWLLKNKIKKNIQRFVDSCPADILKEEK